MARHQVFHSPELGYSVYENDTPDGLIVVESVTHDVEPLLANAAESRAVTAGEKFGEFRLVGVMPLDMAGGMMRDGSFYDEDAIKAFLNNPDFANFRTFKGRV